MITTSAEYVTISRGTASTGTTRIGSNNLLMAYVHVGHDVVIGSNCVIANRVSLAGEVHVGDWVVIGRTRRRTPVDPHRGALDDSGGTLLGQDLPPYVIVRNDTLRFAGINKIGLSRRGFTPERIAEIHDACRILFQSGLNYLNGCDEVEKQIPQSPERDALIEFIHLETRDHQTLRIEIERGVNFAFEYWYIDFFRIFALSKDRSRR